MKIFIPFKAKKEEATVKTRPFNEEREDPDLLIELSILLKDVFAEFSTILKFFAVCLVSLERCFKLSVLKLPNAELDKFVFLTISARCLLISRNCSCADFDSAATSITTPDIQLP